MARRAHTAVVATMCLSFLLCATLLSLPPQRPDGERSWPSDSSRSAHYERGVALRSAGQAITWTSVVIVLAGAILWGLAAGENMVDDPQTLGYTGMATFLVGAVGLGVGVPLWAIGSRRMRLAWALAVPFPAPR